MRDRLRLGKGVLAIVLAAVVAMMSFGCGEQPGATSGDSSGGNSGATSGGGGGGEVKRYAVRGVVMELPGADGKVSIHHEAVPDFVGFDGKVTTMAEMVMDMPLGEGQSIEGIAVGDKVGFTLAVRWKPEAKYWVEDVTKLPGDTALKISGGAGHEDHSGHDHAGH